MTFVNFPVNKILHNSINTILDVPDFNRANLLKLYCIGFQKSYYIGNDVLWHPITKELFDKLEQIKISDRRKKISKQTNSEFFIPSLPEIVIKFRKEKLSKI